MLIGTCLVNKLRSKLATKTSGGSNMATLANREGSAMIGTGNDGHDERFEVSVAAHRIVAEAVVELSLERVDGITLPYFSPGSHIDLEFGNGIVRQYSLLGGNDRIWRVAILREPQSRGGSEAAHQLKTGNRLYVRGPRNHFALKNAPGYIFIAGGIGITPLMPMMAAAETAGAHWHLHYGGRRAGSMAYADVLASAYPGKVTIYPQDVGGLLPLDALVCNPKPETLIYCCGPEPLLQAVEAATAHWPADSLKVERFSPREIEMDGPDKPIEVVLASSGLTVQVGPDQTILEAVTAAGIEVLTSCQEGTCGTCETVVIEGEPDHRDSILTESERVAGKSMMICVSRARSAKLVLDL